MVKMTVLMAMALKMTVIALVVGHAHLERLIDSSDRRTKSFCSRHTSQLHRAVTRRDPDVVPSLTTAVIIAVAATAVPSLSAPSGPVRSHMPRTYLARDVRAAELARHVVPEQRTERLGALHGGAGAPRVARRSTVGVSSGAGLDSSSSRRGRSSAPPLASSSLRATAHHPRAPRSSSSRLRLRALPTLHLRHAAQRAASDALAAPSGRESAPPGSSRKPGRSVGTREPERHRVVRNLASSQRRVTAGELAKAGARRRHAREPEGRWHPTCHRVVRNIASSQRRVTVKRAEWRMAAGARPSSAAPRASGGAGRAPSRSGGTRLRTPRAVV